jgi:succinoglycan biosynthesis transport protein ExoP
MSTPLLQAAQEDQLINVHGLLRTLNHNKWGIASITLVVTVLATLIVYSITPTYEATVTILIEAKGNEPVGQVEDVYDPGYGKMEYYGTQYAILRSRELARRVVEKLDLTKRPEFEAPESSTLETLNWRNWLPFLPNNGSEKPLTEREKAELHKEWAITEFGRRLTVTPVFSTQLVKVTFEAEDPELSTLVANAHAEMFIENSLEARLTIAQKANSWLTEKLANIRTEMQKTDQALQAFREQESLVNVGGERGLVEEELTDSAQRLREARKTSTELASAHWKIQQAGNDPEKLEDISALFQEDVVRDSKESVLEASEVVKQLETRYGPKHPQMIAARARLTAAKNAHHTQLMTAASGIKAQYEIARESERALSQLESGARGTIRGLDRKEYQLRALERDVETNRQLYDMFLSRFKETDLTGNYEVVTARVVDPAVVPREPSKPEKGKIILLAMAGGLFLGLLLVALSELLNDTIRSSEEIEFLTNLPILGVLPLISGSSSTKQLPLQMLKEPKSGFAEGIRSIRTGVVLSDLNHKRKRLIVTSCAPEEGKTTVALNLALAHGQIEKVLLLEGDLRRPSIAKKCGFAKNSFTGLTEVLSGSANLSECIYTLEGSNIDILPISKTPPNPAEILTSSRFRELLELLDSKYDRLIIDSAPCHAVSDTYLLARYCDAMIFVAKAEGTSRRMIKNAMQNLKQADTPLLGTVVNQVDMKRHGRDFGSYYYSYGYYA